MGEGGREWGAGGGGGGLEGADESGVAVDPGDFALELLEEVEAVGAEVGVRGGVHYNDNICWKK
jgi:hypothetical protein